MPRVLTSWKEIAQYLGNGVRTVQRWELDYGLPVRRFGDQTRHAILAIPEEIDTWAASIRKNSGGPLAESLRRDLAALRQETAELKKRMDAIESATFLPAARNRRG